MDDILPDITEFDDRKYIVRFIPKISGKSKFNLVNFFIYNIVKDKFYLFFLFLCAFKFKFIKAKLNQAFRMI